MGRYTLITRYRIHGLKRIVVFDMSRSALHLLITISSIAPAKAKNDLTVKGIDQNGKVVTFYYYDDFYSWVKIDPATYNFAIYRYKQLGYLT